MFDNTGGITLVTGRQRRPFADVLDQHIHSCNQLTSILAKMEASAAGAGEQDVPAAGLAAADEMFVTGTMGEITPVAALDGRRMPVPGPVTARIAARFRALTRDPSQGTPMVR